jgi:hypothetical protein
MPRVKPPTSKIQITIVHAHLNLAQCCKRATSSEIQLSGECRQLIGVRRQKHHVDFFPRRTADARLIEREKRKHV